MAMGHRLFHVDAFVCGPFSGNPAAVVLLDGEADAAWMQGVAGEMNLSETAFVVVGDEVRGGEGEAVAGSGGVFGLRWFTPRCEVELCGHATQASAYVLWERGVVARGEAIGFETLSGVLRAEDRGDEGVGLVGLDFPAIGGEAVGVDEGLLAMLGVEPICAERGRFDLLAELSDADAVRGFEPRLAELARGLPRGLIVTARGDEEGVDFVSRFFAPAKGIDEDPVTGSAHCALGPYWSGRLGKSVMVGRQLSERGGEVRVEVRGERVGLVGRAVMVASGELLV